ncbi:MAG: ATP phosphoribosyltransferase regulatory subunit [Sphingomonadaceae bacterium]|nr:ATP phosphoribosyltransferase regulatory subunit [Sphingomonadaceae bacterium]
MSSGLLPEGLRDRLPPQAEAASRLMHRIVVAIGRHGYARVQPPLAEFEDELVGRLKSARAQDLLRFVDPVSQRTLALRPDLTGQIGRIAATRLANAARPLRLAYGGPVLKLRATQLRPEREMMQAGAELIGSDSVAAVIEVLRVAIEALEVTGLAHISIDLTLPDLIETLGGGGEIAALLDAKDAGGLAAIGAHDYLPYIAAAGPIGPALDALRAIGGKAVASRIDALECIRTALGDRVALTLDPTERHGFEYQSWIGFSLFGGGLNGEVGRGGSYTIVHPGGREEPATGFSLYLDPLVDAGLGTRDVRRAFVPLNGDTEAAAELRVQGWITIAALTEADDAHALGCTHRLEGGEAVAL